ncbi:hypothetical protein QBC36DRAFT_303917 [Triangularia setosa]|uniref:Uncharacterized protein n=1 Tax=Triangularia setosa TaxID=2587417 RepID=A0AAN6W0D0_9PEZI|nr:hypothetical protein QBC36DRAFT_303917 [Podospora setosa]
MLFDTWIFDSRKMTNAIIRQFLDIASRSRTPSALSESSDWDDAQIGKTGDWASDHYSDSGSEQWTLSGSDAESTTSIDDEAEAETETAVQERITAMMDAGAAHSQVGEVVTEPDCACSRCSLSCAGVDPSLDTHSCPPAHPSPGYRASEFPVPEARADLATQYYTLVSRLESSLASELSALPPASPPTPPSPSFDIVIERFGVYNKAYHTAVEVNRLYHLNYGLRPRGLLTPLHDWI